MTEKNESLEPVKFGVSIDAICEYCGRPAGWNTFKSQQNIREYNISGYCQFCQDEVPGEKKPGIMPGMAKPTKKVSGFKSGGRPGGR